MTTQYYSMYLNNYSYGDVRLCCISNTVNTPGSLQAIPHTTPSTRYRPYLACASSDSQLLESTKSPDCITSMHHHHIGTTPGKDHLHTYNIYPQAIYIHKDMISACASLTSTDLTRPYSSKASLIWGCLVVLEMCPTQIVQLHTKKEQYDSQNLLDDPLPILVHN